MFHLELVDNLKLSGPSVTLDLNAFTAAALLVIFSQKSCIKNRNFEEKTVPSLSCVSVYIRFLLLYGVCYLL